MKLKLSDILDNLLVGEFSQTGWAQDGQFSLPTINKIIVLLNAALGDISSRFWVKRKEVFLQTCHGQTLYVLDNSVSSPQARLQGRSCNLTTSTGEVFEDDLQYIYEIYDQHGYEIPIAHDAGSPHVSERRTCKCGKHFQSVSEMDQECYACRNKVFSQTLDKPGTITTRRHPYGSPNYVQGISPAVIQLAAYNTIRVPDGFPPQKLRIIYRATAKRLKPISDQFQYDLTRIDVGLPYEYLQALLYYIASRKFNANKAGITGAVNEGNNYYTKYIAACTLLQDQGAGVEPVGNDGSKFDANGFV